VAQPAHPLEAAPDPGLRPEDELPHPHSAEHPSWHEAWFWDWLDESGAQAGHCRFGIHPNQKRAWLWLYLFAGAEWVGLDEPRLPLPEEPVPGVGWEGWGLRLSFEPTSPLRAGRLQVEGFGRVQSGPRAGLLLPLGVDLAIEGAGPARVRGPGRVGGPGASGFLANRYEQAIGVSGRLRIGQSDLPFRGQGGREHSWGPRSWNLEWELLTLPLPEGRVQASVVRIPEVGCLTTGLFERNPPVPLASADFQLEYRDSDLAQAVSGRVLLRGEDGSVIGGQIESIGAADLDITHLLAPNQRSIWRRALVRFWPRRRGWRKPVPCVGWFESNRFLD
jgi:hypothetical protein